MSKAVFTTRLGSGYDDVPEIRYQFPKQYLKNATKAVGDWVVYYEPRRMGGRQSYFATAVLKRIEIDSTKPGHYYGVIDSATYTQFDRPVPFREGRFIFESGGRGDEGRAKQGWFTNSVRPLPDDEFNLIVNAGLTMDLTLNDNSVDPFEARQCKQDRKRILYSRPMRDRLFSKQIRLTYNNTCALSGLKMYNGDGNPEIEAAHIMPVDDDGPDSVRNGVALSRTFHWLFDKGIISMEDDGKIIKVDKLIPERLQHLLPNEGYATFPDSSSIRPHPFFLNHHRSVIFLG